MEPLEDRRLLATLVVNSPLDNTIAGDSLVTLREAIHAANADTTTDLGHRGSFADEITFDFGHDGPETILLTAGQLVINSDLTVTGAGRQLLTIDASGNDTLPNVDNGSGSRVFDILLRPVIGWNVTLQGMTITGGDVSGRGGAIQAAGHLTLDNVLLVDNAAVSYGGAVAATERLMLVDTTIADNSTQGFGAAIYAAGSFSVTLSNSAITGNTARYSGGGLFIDDSVLTINGGVISDNHAAAVGFRGGGMYLKDTHTLATGVVIAGNEAAEGGGVFALRSRLTFNSSRLNGNHALSGNGGGINIDVTTGGVTLNSSAMSENSSSLSGGAIYSRNSLVAINDSLISDNEANQRGGGVMVRGEGLRLVRSRVTGNVAESSGGGLVAYTTTATPLATLYVADSSIDNNKSYGSGGGIYAYRIFAATIARTTLHTNTANWGGAIAVREVNSLSLSDSTISGNTALTSGGGVITQDSNASLVRSTVTGNRAASNPDGTGAGGGIIAYDGSAISLGNTIIAGNVDPSLLGPDVYLSPGAGFSASTLSASYSLIGDNRGTLRAEAPVGSPDAAGNLVGSDIGQGIIDPKLSPLAYHGGRTFLEGSQMLTHALLPDSPAIDAGDPAAIAGMNGVPTYDQRGEPWARVFDGTGDGTPRIDIGAFERQPYPLAGDYNFSGIVDAADFVVWRKTLGSTVDLRADGNNDGTVDQEDYDVWRKAFGSALPQTYIVDTLADEDDGDYSTSDFSLREAVRLANELQSHDTIEFAALLTSAGPVTIVLTRGELDIGDELTIVGPGAQLLTIDASGNDPTPELNNGDGSRIIHAPRGGLSISGLTLTGGDVTGPGGAVSAVGNFTLRNSVVTENSARAAFGAGHGGGIFVHLAASQTAIIENNIISENVTQQRGGGLYVSSFGGTAELRLNRVDGNRSQSRGGGMAIVSLAGGRSTVTANLVIGNEALGDGGGIWTEVGATPTSLTEIRDTTVAGNRGHVNGGGISATVRNGARLNIVNSTISGNTATSGGGGTYTSSTGHVDVRYSTIVGNNARTGGGLHTDFGDVTLVSSILAENAASHTNPDARFGSAQLTVLHNLIGDNSGTGLAPAPVGMPDDDGNIIGTALDRIDPRLAPLTDNGGPQFLDGSRILTHAPLAASPVIDAGGLALGGSDVPLFDQRGMPFARIANAKFDIGAIELQQVGQNQAALVDEALIAWLESLDAEMPENDLAAVLGSSPFTDETSNDSEDESHILLSSLVQTVVDSI